MPSGSPPDFRPCGGCWADKSRRSSLEHNTIPPSERGLIRRIFISPDEPRLRAGWRLTVHGFVLLALLLITSVAVAIPLAVLGITDLERVSDILLPLAALAMLPAVTLATWLVRRFIDRRSFRSLGLSLGARSWRDLLVGFLIPAPLFAVAYLAFAANGWSQFVGWGSDDLGGLVLSLLAMGVVFMAVGFYEELLFRGYYLLNLIEGTSLPAALLLTSVGFGLAHLGNFSASMASTVGITLAGLFLAYAWYRGGSLWLPIGVHAGWNFFQGPVFGFPVSGTPTPQLIEHRVSGPILITGGGFGPEAGLIVLPIMALGCGLIWLYTRGRTPSAAAQPD